MSKSLPAQSAEQGPEAPGPQDGAPGPENSAQRFSRALQPLMVQHTLQRTREYLPEDFVD